MANLRNTSKGNLNPDSIDREFYRSATVFYRYKYFVERSSSAVECRTRNQGSPGSNPHLVPFRRLGIFVLSIDTPVDSAV